MDKKLDDILDILQNNFGYSRRDHNGSGGGGDRDPTDQRRRFSNGSREMEMADMISDESQASSRMTSRNDSMDWELQRQQRQADEEQQQQTHPSDGERTTLKSSELTKRLERLKDEEDVEKRRRGSQGDTNAKRGRTESRFTVTPSSYTPNNDLSMEAIDISINDDVETDDANKNGDTLISGNVEFQPRQRRHRLKTVSPPPLQPLFGNLKKYQSTPSLPSSPKHNCLKDTTLSTSTTSNRDRSDSSLSATNDKAGIRDDYRRSSSVHFDESSLVKHHRTQSELLPVYNEDEDSKGTTNTTGGRNNYSKMISSLSHPTLSHNSASSSSATSSLQQHQQKQPASSKTTTSGQQTLSTNDIRGNAYVSDIESSDETNSSRNSITTTP